MREDDENAVIKYTIFVAVCGVVLAILFGFCNGGAW